MPHLTTGNAERILFCFERFWAQSLPECASFIKCVGDQSKN